MNRLTNAISGSRLAFLESQAPPVPAPAQTQVVFELKVTQEKSELSASAINKIDAMVLQCQQIVTLCESIISNNYEMTQQSARLSEEISLIRQEQTQLQASVSSKNDSQMMAQIQGCMVAIQENRKMMESIAKNLSSVEKLINRPAVIPPLPTYELDVIARDLNQRTKKIRLSPVS